MPAYSFKERFCPFLLDGSKTQTIRAMRKGRCRHAEPGDIVYLYFGLRTKWCKKLGEGVCVNRKEIIIHPAGDIEIDGVHLSDPHEKNLFAWRDGFRPSGSSEEHPDGAYDLLMRFWRQTHELPFRGVVIYWKPNKN